MSNKKIYETDDGGPYYIVRNVPADGKLESRALKIPATGNPDQRNNDWPVSRLWDEYQAANPHLKGMGVYRAIYNAHLRRSFGSRQPPDITPFDLDRLKLEEMRGKAPKSIANAMELLRRIVNFGVRRGLCAGPGFAIQLPRVSNQKTEDLTQEELTRLVSILDRHLAVRSSRTAGAAMMKLALYTGMRRGEIFRLKWSDLDFHRGNIRLREPKGGRDAVIPMSSHARRLFESLKRTESDLNLECQTGGSAVSGYVFPGISGGQRRDVRRLVNSIKAEAALPEDFRPLHGLRHVFASGLISSGVEFQIVQRLLTHKGGTVTHRYAHIRDDALRAAAELAGQLIEEAGAAGQEGDILRELPHYLKEDE